jgi:nucleoside-diphosphate-sugar epimerase
MIELMEADGSKLVHRNAFNVTAMSFNPEQLAAEIRAHVPGFVMEYEIDPVRQAIADSWPNSMDDSAARKEWGWKPQYDVHAMTADMIKEISRKLQGEVRVSH